MKPGRTWLRTVVALITVISLFIAFRFAMDSVLASSIHSPPAGYRGAP